MKKFSLFDSNMLETGILGPYQNTDKNIIDYQQFILGGKAFRGPLPKKMYSKDKITFLGAAQTFGRFVRLPFPTITGSLFDLDTLNLGYAGAGASFYLKNPYIISQAQNARVAVIQVMSGRSCANSIFDTPEGRNTLTRRSDGANMTDGPGYTWLLKELGADRAVSIVRESQEKWVDEMISLAKKISIPKILFWFSGRSTEFTPRGENTAALMGEFPHFISTQMITEVKPYFSAYVECVSRRGLPYQLRDRYTGEAISVNFAGSTRTINTYYPSAQMHLDAAIALEKSLQSIIRS